MLTNINSKEKEYPKILKTSSKIFKDLLNNIRFIGKWKDHFNNKIFINNEGIIKFNFFSLFDNNNSKFPILGNILLLDPFYYDENIFKLNIYLEKEKYNNFKNKNITKDKIYIRNFNSLNLIKTWKCKLNIEILFNKLLFKNEKYIYPNKFFSLKNPMKIKIFNNSTNCKINLEANLNYEKKSFFEDFFYIFFVINICLLNFYSSTKLVKKLSDNLNENNNFCNSISIITITIICSIDFFLSIFHLLLSVDNETISKNNYFLFFTPSFWFFIIFSLIDLNVLFLIWKYKNINLFNNDFEEFKRKFNTFHFQIYIYCFIFIILFMKFFLSPYIIILLSCLLVPQIFKYSKFGMIFDFDFNYIVNFCISRFLILFYFRLNKNNLLMIRPYYGSILISICILIFSILFIYSQSYFGPKYFFPKFLKKNKYDYFNINKKCRKIYNKELKKVN